MKQYVFIRYKMRDVNKNIYKPFIQYAVAFQ